MSSIRRITCGLSAAVLCATLLASCGSTAPDSPSEPAGQSATVDSDRGRVDALTLRADDLPLGFAAVDGPSTIARPVLSSCMPELFGASATTTGATFVRQAQEVTSQSYTFATAAQATNALASLTTVEVQSCLSGLVRTQMDQLRSATIAGDVLLTPSVTPLDPSTAQYRYAASKSAEDRTQPVAVVDLLVLQADRSVSGIWLAWPEAAPDPALETRMVTAMRARAVAAFDGRGPESRP